MLVLYTGLAEMADALGSNPSVNSYEFESRNQYPQVWRNRQAQET